MAQCRPKVRTSERRVHCLARPVRRTSGDNGPVVEERIHVGDTVVLKTGGPSMTVQALSMSLAYCAWTLAGQRRQGTFEVDTLDVVGHARRSVPPLRNSGPASP